VTGQTEGRLGAGRVIVALYVAGIIGAEVIAVVVGPVAGAACDAALILALLNSCALAPDRPESPLLGFLALAPLLRLLSLTMPYRHVAEIWWYALVGAPLLLAVFIATRAIPVRWPGLRLRRGDVPLQLGIALTGVPIGAAAYEILTPDPLISPLTVWTLIGGSVLLIVFSAVAEELVFRGPLQWAARELFGSLGLVMVSALFAALYIGSLSVAYVAFAGAVGLWFAFVVDRTELIWGAIGAHALWNIGLLVVWPAVHG
jgi:uncharacterized protein